ncbi:serine protease SohB [Ferrimonas sediminum]|uniref:Serine protease SohB n=1 Tax=Ferrimonas sediminum TaxID=718193 RepID=A0A1G8YHY7_9GAMM|nr:protease SohB [Ferrimonas sediminum]SDK02024.1 serine protease SohB [Ferrimonas sediminum]
MEFLFEYGLFLAKALTLVVAVVAIILVVAQVGRSQRAQKGELQLTCLSDQLEDYQHHLESALLSKEQLKAKEKAEKKAEKARQKKEKANVDKPREGRVFVLDFKAGIEAFEVVSLREEISALLTVADKQDQVLVRLESGGGMVHAYGLASSQLARLRDAGIPLTIAVDKVAASGGYMMACVADHIVAAPFSIIGSIGVIAQLPNFNKLLKKSNIEFEQHTAGEFKRTLTMFGENTDSAREKFREELEETHGLFKDFIGRYRPELDLGKVATGEHWFATQALDLGLVDELSTSDDWLMKQAKDKEVLKLSYVIKKNLANRFGRGASEALETLAMKLAELNQRSRV